MQNTDFYICWAKRVDARFLYCYNKTVERPFRAAQFLCSCSLLLQINQQHRDIRRADAGDTARLPDGHGADLG